MFDPTPPLVLITWLTPTLAPPPEWLQTERPVLTGKGWQSAPTKG